MFIRSERLFLRPGWPEDRADLLAAIGDEAVVRNLANAPWPYGEADAEMFLARPHVRLLPRFLITVPSAEGARVIGGIGLNPAEGGTELGYWIAREQWGRGYATEAARAVVGLARTLGHRRLLATHFLDNPASGRVLEKAGFRRTDRVIDRFSEGRGHAFPAREFALVLEPAVGGDSGENDLIAGNRQAA